MSGTDDHLDLDGGLDQWNVTLRSGHLIRVAAVGYSEKDGCFVFSGLECGKPRVSVDLSWIPVETVEHIRGPFPAASTRPKWSDAVDDFEEKLP